MTVFVLSRADGGSDLCVSVCFLGVQQGFLRLHFLRQGLSETFPFFSLRQTCYAVTV